MAVAGRPAPEERSDPMAEYLGRGDPRRSLALLWGADRGPARGPKPGLTVAQVVEAAIAVADAEGLEGLSMRRVAQRLGVSVMALYTYVPGKAELLDVMLDTVQTEVPAPGEVPGPARWRAAVEAAAHAEWELYQRHDWMLQVSGSRALLGPAELALYESRVRLFDGLGLSAVEITRMVAVLVGFVRGAALAVSDARAAERATGMSDDEWWLARSARLDEVAGDVWHRYPTLVRLAAEHAFDQADRAPDDATPYTVRDALDSFAFGLQRLLDGMEVLVRARLDGADAQRSDTASPTRTGPGDTTSA